jgi:hydroxymethylbilane synthase
LEWSRKSVAAVALPNYNWQIMKLRIGTRGSKLALAQADETKARLIAAHNLDSADIDIIVISTTGDRVKDRPLAEIGGKGLFTKEIEEALLANEIDLAVHSMKDMPAVIADHFEIAALLPREDARDAFISTNWGSLDDLPQGANLGSSSVRRTAQALGRRPDLVAVPFRGNVETRLRKLEDGVAEATFLACAGLNRLGLSHHIKAHIPMDVMRPAVAQGAIGIEIRRPNETVKAIVQALNHAATATAIACERAFLESLDGSCRTPIAGHATLEDGHLSFNGETLTLDGKSVFKASRNGSAQDAARMGKDAADEIRKRGGALIT